ncbi:MAG TPA: prolyl oligopeptidase family serine peptidase, partial [Acidobacteriaceae bacterium]
QHGSSGFTHQWIATDRPLPSDTPTTVGSDATATSSAGPQPMRWPEPNAAALARAKEMSPMTYIRPGLPPTFIVNGDSDRTVDPSQSAELKKALDAAGVPNGQDLVPGGGHGNFSKAETDKAMLLCLEFLKSNGIIQ